MAEETVLSENMNTAGKWNDKMNSGQTLSVHRINYSSSLILIAMSVLLTYIGTARAEPVNGRKGQMRVVAVMHCEYSPVSFWNKTTNTPSGFFVDIMDSVAARAGLQVSYICKNGWDEMIACDRERRSGHQRPAQEQGA